MIFDQKSYLSQDKFNQLKVELEMLKTAKRLEISSRLEESKKLGDLSENSEYIEAKEAQEQNERKVNTPSTEFPEIWSRCEICKHKSNCLKPYLSSTAQDRAVTAPSAKWNSSRSMLSSATPISKNIRDIIECSQCFKKP